MKPPVAPVRPHVHREHGVERHDPYFWLRHREDPGVVAYVGAENRYTEHVLGPLEGLRKQLFDEMLARIQETDASATVPWGGWLYYSRTVQGLAYPIHCRRPRAGGDEQVLLDVNALADGHDYTSLGAYAISPDHRLLAYAVDHTGREIYRVRILDLSTGEYLPDELAEVSGDVTWAADGRTLFYTILDEALRPWRLHRHVLGGDQSADPVVLDEPDERFRLYTTRTRSNAFVVVVSTSSLTTECHVVDARRPDGPLRCLQPRHAGMRYSVEHHGDRFLILTNDADDPQGNHTDAAVNFKLMEAPLDATSREQWRERIGHRPEVQLARVDAFRDHLVLTEREGGLAHLRVLRLSDGDDHRITLPEPTYALGLHSNPEFDTDAVQFTYSSLNRPGTTYRYDMNARTREVVKVEPVLGDFDPERYTVERISATAPDGTAVPVSLVYRNDVPRDGSAPWLLYGYGSYGLTIDAGFNSLRLSLLDRGVGFAIAHIRGGGAMGKPWHEVAKFKGKKHTFDDFIAAAEALIGGRYTSPEHLAIMGGSAGGLLMGAVINKRPELFRCCVAQVPFVDVVTTMLDESLPLTANEWEEWGDPRKEDFFRYMLSYSPYDNVRDVRYPDLLVVSGMNDPRVQYWEPTKWVARIRATVSEANRGLVALKTHMGAGHQGRSGRYGYIDDRAFDYAFVLDRLGVTTA